MAQASPPLVRQDDSLLDLITQTAPDAIITIDQAGRILSFNPAAERMFGHKEHEVLGRNVSCLMPQPFRDQHDGYIARYLRTGEKRIIGIGREAHALRKSGEVFPMELAVGELRTGSTRVFTGFIRDVSDRVAAQANAARLRRELEHVARIQMVGELAAALSHEINQPLAAIANFARAARRTLAGDPPDIGRTLNSLDEVAEQAQRAGEIMKRMRRYVDRGRIEPQPEDLNDIVTEAVRLDRQTADEWLQIELELAPNLPRVLADRVQIQQVVLNLLRNAREAILETGDAALHVATGIGPPVGTIRLKAAQREDEVIFSVRDTGSGVPEELLSRMFEPFTTTKKTGLGVGLAVCRSIIEAHGGRIWVENGPTGAEFHFTVPVANGSS